ncbi:MAG: hypothetical protein R3300_13005 [Candidatus Promineifilaceae bacterium]|nr:hypothetical protein [Candidatus Promineifilaceae bacterium]
MNHDRLIDWLLTGDVAVRYQVQRDLLGRERPDLQQRIATEGWGARFLGARQPDGHWGRGFYMPKWTSSHYTLLDLKHLGLPPSHPAPAETIALILRQNRGSDGGINPAMTIPQSDICIQGMFLTYACYFDAEPAALTPIVDYILSEQVADGGFNCRSNRGGAVHSSLHTTLSILEGVHEYASQGYTYRLDELQQQAAASREFILQHRLFLSDRTGTIIDRKFLMFSYPSRWRYDILRALDYFRAADRPYYPRLQPALDVVQQKRRKDGRWPVQARHAGQTHFDMEPTGRPSRWNTLRALRVLAHFQS